MAAALQGQDALYQCSACSARPVFTCNSRAWNKRCSDSGVSGSVIYCRVLFTDGTLTTPSWRLRGPPIVDPPPRTQESQHDAGDQLTTLRSQGYVAGSL